MIFNRWLASGTSKEFHWIRSPVTKEPVLVTSNRGEAYGLFKAVTRATAGTTIITDPEGGGSIILTDLVISAGKFSAGTTTVRFTDGTDTIDIVVMDNTDAPLALAIPFRGNWQGWRDARLELVTVNDVTVTVSAGYIKVDVGLDFAAWDGLR